MKKVENMTATAMLYEFCRLQDDEATKTIEYALVQLAGELEGGQNLIRAALLKYRAEMPKNPSAEEFYELVCALANAPFAGIRTDDKSAWKHFSEGAFDQWCSRKNAPRINVRRHFMCIILDEYLECGMQSGHGRLADAIQRCGGDPLFNTPLYLTVGDLSTED